MARSPALSLYLLGTRSEGPSEPPAPPWPTRPDARLIWFHTGRALLPPALAELIARLDTAGDNLGFLVTSTENPGKPLKQYDFCHVAKVPDERTGEIRAFLDHWAPDLAIWTECDLRPALIVETGRAGVPMLMIDARTAAPNAAGWRWRRGMLRELIGTFERILCGDAAAMAEIRKMGARSDRIENAGYLEEGSGALPCSETECDALAALLSARRIWLAAGVLPDEATAAVSAHRALMQQSHRLMLIMVPRDPATGPDLAKALAADGWIVGLRSDGAEPDPGTQIYVADTDDEYGLWYRLSPISFLGTSLFEGGGRNPYEAAALGSAILHGPNVQDHRDAYARFAEAGAARLVRSAEELAGAVETLLSPEVAARMAQAAWSVSSAGAEVTDKVIDMVLQALDREAEA